MTTKIKSKYATILNKQSGKLTIKLFDSLEDYRNFNGSFSEILLKDVDILIEDLTLKLNATEIIYGCKISSKKNIPLSEIYKNKHPHKSLIKFGYPNFWYKLINKKVEYITNTMFYRTKHTKPVNITTNSFIIFDKTFLS